MLIEYFTVSTNCNKIIVIVVCNEILNRDFAVFCEATNDVLKKQDSLRGKTKKYNSIDTHLKTLKNCSIVL